MHNNKYYNPYIGTKCLHFSIYKKAIHFVVFDKLSHFNMLTMYYSIILILYLQIYIKW